jgi:hypothetical protein
VTPLAEIQSGAVGEAFVALLARSLRAVAAAGNFPPPDGHARWDADAVATAVADFLASPQTPRRLTDLATHCRSDDALRARMQRTVRNYFADLGRRTPVGRLVLRFNEVLKDDPAFQQRSGYWSLTGCEVEPAAVDIDTLVAAMSHVDVVVPTAWTTGDRQSPDIDAASAVRLVRSALEVAAGSLRASVLAQAAAARLGLGAAPLSLEATGFDPPGSSPVSSQATEDQVLVNIRVDEVCFGRINDLERFAIGLVDVPVARLGPLLGVSGSQAALIRSRATAILKSELREEEDGQAVADAVLERARHWAESWMSGERSDVGNR